jgi:hypothetical protein
LQEPECHETGMGEVADDRREVTGLRRRIEKRKYLFVQN